MSFNIQEREDMMRMIIRDLISNKDWTDCLTYHFDGIVEAREAMTRRINTDSVLRSQDAKNLETLRRVGKGNAKRLEESADLESELCSLRGQLQAEREEHVEALLAKDYKFGAYELDYRARVARLKDEHEKETCISDNRIKELERFDKTNEDIFDAYSRRIKRLEEKYARGRKKFHGARRKWQIAREANVEQNEYIQELENKVEELEESLDIELNAQEFENFEPILVTECYEGWHLDNIKEKNRVKIVRKAKELKTLRGEI